MAVRFSVKIVRSAIVFHSVTTPGSPTPVVAAEPGAATAIEAAMQATETAAAPRTLKVRRFMILTSRPATLATGLAAKGPESAARNGLGHTTFVRCSPPRAWLSNTRRSSG